MVQRDIELVKGNLFSALKNLLEKNLLKFEENELILAVTGSGQSALEIPEQVYRVNEINALVFGANRIFPGARSVFDIGAENARWVQFKPSFQDDSVPEIDDFSLNERCAAGTGLFLEQQAYRLKLSIEEFCTLASKAKKGAPVAGRCSVFAKSDMIHLQQKGTPLEEIAYGVCLALVRSVTSSLLRGKSCPFPVALAGGTVKNAGLLRAFRQILKAEENQLLYSDDSLFLSASGAAFLAKRNQDVLTAASPGELISSTKPKAEKKFSDLKSLGQLELSSPGEPTSVIEHQVKGYLGIDIGSVSTNLVVIDENNQVITGVYLPTRGQPLEVLKEGLSELFSRCPAGLKIMGIGTTGSGRYLAGRLLKADAIKNEITCQMRSTCYHFPDVDTIFEIGGQDSKYIQVNKSKVVDFNLNKICAAGTGSFLEEQAAQLGFKVEEDFARLASLSGRPYDLGSRCTVFMESELIQASSRSQPLPDLVAGLAYSIARNYLEKVVERRPVGNKIVFQGGVASNDAVVKAFSELLGKEIKVHPYNRISGAIGAAMEARERVRKSGKKSLEVLEIKEKLFQPLRLSTFECQKCSNHCQVVSVSSDKEEVFFGDICERYTAKSQLETRAETFHNPLVFRRQLVEAITVDQDYPGPTIGLPRALTFQEFLPFWKVFFNKLGYRVKVSPETSAEIMEAGIRLQPAETCLPIKIALGHVKFLQDDPEVDLVFLPSLIDSHKQKGESYYFCPYTEHLPYMLPEPVRERLLTLPIYLQSDPESLTQNFKNLSRVFKDSEEKIEQAWEAGWKAQMDFNHKLGEKGKEILSRSLTENRTVWIICSRPYLLYDNFVNLNLWFHLEKLGIEALPVDYLPLDEIKFETLPIEPSSIPPWRYPQRLLKAAAWCRNQTETFPVFLTNYGCGVDGFSIKQTRNFVAERPHLFLEFDEHRGEAGLITRLEAFADEISQYHAGSKKSFLEKKAIDPESFLVDELKKMPFIIPWFADHAIAFAGALKKCGIQAEVLPAPDKKSLELGEKHSSGKECHAFSFLLGDLLKYAFEKKSSEPQVFFYPGARYSCLLQQYGPAMRNLLDELGMPNIFVLTPSLDYFWKLIGLDGLKTLWQGLVAVDRLIKLSCQLRPYEINWGETHRFFQESLKLIEESLARGELEKGLEKIRAGLKKIKTKIEERPIVGIAGDIYTRQNSFANKNLYQRLEELGCEVWPSPFLVDEIDFTFSKDFNENLASGNLKETLRLAGLNLLKDTKKRQVVKKLEFSDLKIKEPGFEDMVRSTASYLSFNNNQTLFLNVARMIDFARKGADGIINVICFNCLLGTTSAAISARIRKDFGNIPLPTLIYGETESSNEQTRLEAFAEQVKARYKKRESLDSRFPASNL
jgi:predicted CoA-substrate-specific enzyme activase